jgi:hypothetical protein
MTPACRPPFPKGRLEGVMVLPARFARVSARFGQKYVLNLRLKVQDSVALIYPHLLSFSFIIKFHHQIQPKVMVHFVPKAL